MRRSDLTHMVAIAVLTLVTCLALYRPADASYNRPNYKWISTPATEALNVVTDVTELGFPVDANSTYLVKGWMRVLTTSTSAGCRLQIAGPAGATWVGIIAYTNSSTTNAYAPVCTGIATEIGFNASFLNPDNAAYFTGIITTAGTAGTVVPKFRSSVSGQTITIEVPSTLEYRKIS